MINHTNFEVNDLHPLKDGELAGSDRIIVAHNPKSPDRPVSSATVDQLTSRVNSGAKIYTALLTQSGTGGPSAVILENSIGDIVWTRQSTGVYVGTLAGAFPTGKTLVMFNSGGTADTVADSVRAAAYYDSVNTVRVIVVGSGDSPTDDELLNATLQIKVYP